MYFCQVVCAECRKTFIRSVGQVNEAKKFHWKQFCSWNCLASSKMTGSTLQCLNPQCKKKFYRLQNQIKKVRKSFCSQSCATIINNKERSEKLVRKQCATPGCNISIPSWQNYCSIVHATSSRKISPEQYKQKIIAHIQSFYNNHGRIPLKRELNSIYKVAWLVFGSWNNAIIAAGYNPNPVLFAEKQIANDGHPCDSLAEKIIDDWLTTESIEHKRSIPYPEGKRLKVDFVIENHWIEFFGLAGEVQRYDELVRIKRRLCKKHNLKLVEVYPKDLFPTNHLSEILNI
ncbi:MAG: hypothetical protein G01um101433_670 [Parcubacteria group bacterium Gr01-1014_33]|nr:MAG: hypothetical protein G01um101433_670 [Parcubacteria group bacterium Gr01-1014_33]